MLTSNKSLILSDQYDNWSDNFDETFCPLSSKTSSGPLAPPATAQFCPPRLFDRALQKLRQTRLQVRPGTWTRTQVLPFDQSIRRPSRHGLRAAGFTRDCRPVPGKLSFGSRNLGSNLQHQPRTASSQRALIENQRVPGEHAKPHAINRSPPRRHSDCKHARSLLADRAVRNPFRGDH